MQMNGAQRRQKILELLLVADGPLSGSALAEKLGVSRQIIVQDMALLRTAGEPEILSTYQGYVIHKTNAGCSRVFKVRHSPGNTEQELLEIVDLGGRVADVFVYHRVYGVVKCALNIRSRKDVRAFMERLRDGRSALLMEVTDAYHYHTVFAEDVQTLDQIQSRLGALGFLAPLREHEPIDFWNK